MGWLPDPDDPSTMPSRRFPGPTWAWALVPWLLILAMVAIMVLLAAQVA